MLLGWRFALYLAGGSAIAATLVGTSRLRQVSPWLGETAFVLLLYAVWQRGLDLAANHVRGAVHNGMRVWRAERWLHLPSERAVQRWFLHVPDVVRALNYFYAVAHVQDVIVCLVWVFWRHRQSYRRARNELAWLTLATLAVQIVPVAPPRLLAATGVVDAGRLLGYAIYAPNGLHDASQLLAMPSVHLAWALWVAVTVIEVSPSRWRWLVVAYPLLTTVAIVATGYHFWLDGVAAAVLLLAVRVARSGVEKVRRPLRVPTAPP